jgi:hypothetical protein
MLLLPVLQEDVGLAAEQHRRLRIETQPARGLLHGGGHPFVAQVVEDVVGEDPPVRELDEFAAVVMVAVELRRAACRRSSDALAGAPVMVSTSAEAIARQPQGLAVHPDPALLTTEGLVSRARPAHRQVSDDISVVAVGGTLRLVPVDLEGDAVVVLRQGQTQVREGFQDLDLDRSHGHVHPVLAEQTVAAHRRVSATVVHDGERLGRAEVRVKTHPHRDIELALAVNRTEPDPFVRPGVRRPHHADGKRAVVNHELVEP